MVLTVVADISKQGIEGMPAVGLARQAMELQVVGLGVGKGVRNLFFPSTITRPAGLLHLAQDLTNASVDRLSSATDLYSTIRCHEKVPDLLCSKQP